MLGLIIYIKKGLFVKRGWWRKSGNLILLIFTILLSDICHLPVGQEAVSELISEATNGNRAQEETMQLEKPKIKADDLLDFRTNRETSDINKLGGEKPSG